MVETRVVLVHGAATTPAVWDTLAELLSGAGIPGLQVVAPQRRCSGDLGRELATLSEVAHDAFVVGASGGATLGLALLASNVHLAGAVLHEPAVGSLVPGLLDRAVAGYTAGGVPGFGRALYGPGWTPEMAGDDPGAVARDLAMFRRFEPDPIAPGQGWSVTTVGAESPPVRHEAARALEAHLGITTKVLTGSGHFVAHDNPQALATVVLDLIRRSAPH